MAALKKQETRAAGTDLHGQLAGEYRILRRLGSGGFGTVYEAEHPLLKRRAAVKVLHSNPAVDSIAVKRFIEEARSASQIRHRHIVDIFSFGTLPNGQYFYVMDLLEGAPLDGYLNEQGRLAPEVALPLLRPIANAIDALHAASLVHRDLKPGNIFLAWESSGEVVPKLLDFGLVKLLDHPSVHSASGVPMGTPYYMAPEQCRGEAVDGRADVYSFGVICFELLTGKRPFAGESATSVLLAHVVQAPPRMSELCPELSVDLDEAVLRMLAKDPEARPASVGAALREVELAARGAGVTISDGLPWLPRPVITPPPEVHGFEVDATVEQSGMRNGPRGVEAGLGRKRAVLVASGLTLLVLLGVTALLRSSSDSSLQPTAADPVQAAATSPGKVPPAQAEPGAPPQPMTAAGGAAPLRQVPLRVRGAPAGAEVWFGEQKLGEAPGPVLLPYGEVPIRLKIAAPGWGVKTISVTPNAAQELAVPSDKPARGTSKRALPRDLENPF